MSEDVRKLLEKIAGTDTNDPDWSKSDLRAIRARHAESAKAALTTQPAPLSQQASGWTTVTEDEATWPLPTDLLLEHDRHGRRMMHANEVHKTSWYAAVGFRWMPWPSPLSPPDGMRELLEKMAELEADWMLVGAMSTDKSRGAAYLACAGLLARLRAEAGNANQGEAT